MTTAALDDAIRNFAAERHYAAKTVDRWLHLAPADRKALLDLARELRLGEHQLGDLWEWAEEIALRDGTSIAAVLDDALLRTAGRQQLGRNDRLKLVKEALRRLRFPELSATQERLASLVRALNLPANVRVVLPAHLEGDAIRVEIAASSPGALQVAAERLHAAAASPECVAD
jgi:hypothetical protein